MAKQKLFIMVVDMIKPGRDAKVKEIMTRKVIPAVRKQLPDFKWKLYRPVIGKMGLLVVIAPIDSETLVKYDEWIFAALEKEHGSEDVARYAAELYDCIESSEYIALTEDAEMSNG